MAATDRYAIPRISGEVAWVEVDGSVVALDPRTSQVHLLEGSAALLFPLLDGDATVGEIASDVADVFGIPEAEALAQIVQYSEDLAAAGLVEVMGQRADG